MRPYVGICTKKWADCKCRHCKRSKPVRNQVRPKGSVRNKLKKLLRMEVDNG